MNGQPGQNMARTQPSLQFLAVAGAGRTGVDIAKVRVEAGTEVGAPREKGLPTKQRRLDKPTSETNSKPNWALTQALFPVSSPEPSHLPSHRARFRPHSGSSQIIRGEHRPANTTARDEGCFQKLLSSRQPPFSIAVSEAFTMSSAPAPDRTPLGSISRGSRSPVRTVSPLGPRPRVCACVCETEPAS